MRNTINLQNNLGIITDNRVIIYKGKETNIFYIDKISYVNLTKTRNFYTNLFFMCIAGFTILLYDSDMPVGIQIAIAFTSLISILMGVFHKFYLYQISINLRDNRRFVLKTNQFQKNQTKKFYISLMRILRNKKTV